MNEDQKNPMHTLNDTFDFFRFCELLFEEWRLHQFKEEEILQKLFQMDFSPEPFFEIINGENPIYLLLTNPGSGMDFQHIENRSKGNYLDFSKQLAGIYTSNEFKNGKGSRNAYRRIKKSLEFSNYLGFNALINIETIPFHSEILSKHKALEAISKSYTLSSYQNVLKKHLEDKPVLIVSACNSKQSISNNTIRASKWLSYQCDLANIKIENLEMEPLTQRENKITSALFKNANDKKYIVLTMGSNNLPSIKM